MTSSEKQCPLIIDFKRNGAGTPATEQLETISDSREYLKKIRENNGFPVGVNTFNPPFSSGTPGEHVVTSEGYDPGPPERVLINNNWGQASDLFGFQVNTIAGGNWILVNNISG